MMDQLTWIKKLEKGDDNDGIYDSDNMIIGNEIIVKNK